MPGAWLMSSAHPLLAALLATVPLEPLRGLKQAAKDFDLPMAAATTGRGSFRPMNDKPPCAS